MTVTEHTTTADLHARIAELEAQLEASRPKPRAPRKPRMPKAGSAAKVIWRMRQAGVSEEAIARCTVPAWRPIVFKNGLIAKTVSDLEANEKRMAREGLITPAMRRQFTQGKA